MKQAFLRLLNISIILFILFSCKKDEFFMDVGKYEVYQYAEYPNGDKDTIHYFVYGPRYNSKNYYFDSESHNTYFRTLSINDDLSMFSFVGMTSDSLFGGKIVTSFTKTSTTLNLSYSPNLNVYQVDSTSGTIIFNRISL